MIVPVGVSEGDEFDVEIAENVNSVEQQQNALDDDSLLGDIEALLDTHDGCNEELLDTTAAELKKTVAEKAQQQVLADPAFGELASLLEGLTGSDSDASSESAESEDQPEPEPADLSATDMHGSMPRSKRRYSMSLLPGAMDDFLAVVDLPTEADDMGQDIAEHLTTLHVACPDGVGPGDLLYIQYDGAELSVTVPVGVSPGDTFEVSVDAEEEEDEEIA